MSQGVALVGETEILFINKALKTLIQKALGDPNFDQFDQETFELQLFEKKSTDNQDMQVIRSTTDYRKNSLNDLIFGQNQD